MAGYLAARRQWRATKNRYLNVALLCIFCNPAVAAETVVKYGVLDHDETWRDTVYLVGDVTVPKNVTLTIEPGTQLLFANYDIFESGKDKTHAEIIVHGTLNALSSPENPITVNTIGDEPPEPWRLDQKTTVIEFHPYQVETEPLRQEFRSFKRQYIVLWSIVYAMWILAI